MRTIFILLVLALCSTNCYSENYGVYEIAPNKIVIDTILLEAVGENGQGQIGVAEVIRNRAIRKQTTEAQICLSRLQFSCWNDRALAKKKLAKIDKNPEYRKIAERAWYEARRTNITNNATSYCNRSVCNPKWARKMLKTVKLGNHTFYREK